jgi:hypothetical protein
VSFGVPEDHPPRQILTHHNFVPFRTVFSCRPGIRDQKALRCRKNQTPNVSRQPNVSGRAFVVAKLAAQSESAML